jgi:hypothetical protein
MKSLLFLLITAFVSTSCVTHKYGCKYAKKETVYRSNGQVVVVDTNTVIIRLNGSAIIVDSGQYDIVQENLF